MRIKEKRFSVPFCALIDELPLEAFRLLCFLFSESDFQGKCCPGYNRIRAVLRIGSKTTVSAALRTLENKGWIFHRKKGGSCNETIWLCIPLRYRAKQRPKAALSVVN